MEDKTKQLAKTVTQNLANPEIQEFLQNIIFPRLPRDLEKDPHKSITYLQIHNAINHTVGVNLYFLIYIIAYDTIVVTEQLWNERPSHKEIGSECYRWEYLQDYDGNFISGVSDFLDYVANEIKASQRTLWSKVTLIRNLINLDMTREEVYDLFFKGAWTIQQVLSSIGKFRNGRLEEISDATLDNYIKKFPEEREEIRRLQEDGSEKSKALLVDKVKPEVRSLVKDLNKFESSRMIRQWEDEFVNPPEINFKFIPGGFQVEEITFMRDEHDNKVRSDYKLYKFFIANKDGRMSEEISKILSDLLPIRARRS